MNTWINKGKEAARQQPLILVGIGIDQMRDFIHLGATIRGAISILPKEGPPYTPDEPFPVLVLEGKTRHVLDLVASDFGLTFERNAREIRAFLDSIDPKKEAVVVSYLPLPHEVLRFRNTWAQDYAVTSSLENKHALGEILAECLSVVPSIETNSPLDQEAWKQLCEQFGSEELVIQKNGLSIGGTQTFLCEKFEKTKAVFKALKEQPLRITPLMPGDSLNIMGLVVDEKRTIVLPPSQQILCRDRLGRPLYGGNSLITSLSDKEIIELTEKIRSFGKKLAKKAFYGPFGLDFIHGPDGIFWFHDLNPRMNGVVDSLSLYLTDGEYEPLRVLLLSRLIWTESEIMAFEKDLRLRSASHPLIRYFLSREVEAAWTIKKTPPGGLWEIDPENLRIRHLAAGKGTAVDVKGQTALLRPLLSPKSSFQPMDRLVLGDLFCSSELSAALEKRWGSTLPRQLIDIMVG